MNHARTLSLVAFVAGLPLCACSGAGNPTESPPPTDGGATQTQAELQGDVRAAWVSELQWSRFYATSALAGGADATAQFTQLMQAEDEIASEVGAFFGANDRATLASLLHARASTLSNLVAQLDSRSVATSTSTTKLDANASAIAAFFQSVSPYVWNDLDRVLQSQADAIHDGVVARAQGDDARAATDFASAEQSTLAIADDVTGGLAKLFPGQVSAPTNAPAADTFRLDLHSGLDDHAFWFRAWLVDYVAHRAAQDELDRAVQSSYDVGDAFGSLYGTGTGSELQWNIHNDTTDAVAFVFASESNDPVAIDAIGKQWNADADRLARALVGVVPNLDLGQLERLVSANVDSERAMIGARFSSQWTSDVQDYAMVVSNLGTIGDTVADALSSRLPAAK